MRKTMQTPTFNGEHLHAKDVPVEDRLRALIDMLSAYIEHYHGGWVRMVSFDGQILKVELGGACTECPLSETTLHGWVEGSVRQFFPEISRIEHI
jgi:Fe-S cluster biogenesis protein NfuA